MRCPSEAPRSSARVGSRAVERERAHAGAACARRRFGCRPRRRARIASTDERVAGRVRPRCAAAEHQGAVADIGDFLEVGGDDQDGEAAREGPCEQARRSRPWRRHRRRPSAPRGSAASRRSEPAGDDDLLLVAAGQGLDRPAPGRSGRTPKRRTDLRAWRASRPGDASRAARRPLAAGLRNRFSRTLSGMARLSPVRSPATRPIPARIAASGLARSGRSPSRRTVPASTAASAEQRPADLLLAGAAQADQAQHLAGAQRRGRPGPRRRPQIARAAAPAACRWLRRARRPARAAGRRSSSTSSRGVVSATGLRPTSWPSRSTATRSATLEDLVQAVRDVDHADAAAAQRAQHGEEPLHLVGRQAGGGLVEHDQLGLDGERPGDGDQRFLGARQARAPARRDRCRRRPRPALARAALGLRASRSGRTRRGKPRPIAMFSATVIHSIRPRS